MPLIMVLMLTRFFGREEKLEGRLRVLPFTFSPAWLHPPMPPTGVFLGPEFPSLLGGLVSLAIVCSAAPLGFPGAEDLGLRPGRRMAEQVAGQHRNEARQPSPSNPQAPCTWLPYVLVGALLVVSRVFQKSAPLKSMVLVFPDIPRQAGIKADFMPLPAGI